MLKVIRNLLLKIVDNIDAGNSNITEEEAVKIVDSLKRFTDKEKRLSKYAACEHLNISRATFDNYVREGKLPRGKHEIGFKELSWSEKELDESVKKCGDNALLRSRKHSLT
nr:MAG TPA: Pyocin activator protein PrtN [Crassvirales sp.]